MGVTEGKTQSRDSAGLRTSGRFQGMNGFCAGNGHRTKLPSAAANMRLQPGLTSVGESL